jgi:hypothetical protein
VLTGDLRILQNNLTLEGMSPDQKTRGAYSPHFARHRPTERSQNVLDLAT